MEREDPSKKKTQSTKTQILETLRDSQHTFFYWCILQLSPVCVLYVGSSVGNVNQLVSPVWFCRVMKWLGELEDISVTPLLDVVFLQLYSVGFLCELSPQKPRCY